MHGAGFLRVKQGWVTGLAGKSREAGHGSLGLGGSKRYSCPARVNGGCGLAFINRQCVDPPRERDLTCGQAAKRKMSPPPTSREKRMLVRDLKGPRLLSQSPKNYPPRVSARPAPCMPPVTEGSLRPKDTRSVLDRSHQKAMTQWTWTNSSQKRKYNWLTNISENAQPSLAIEAMQVKTTEKHFLTVR